MKVVKCTNCGYQTHIEESTFYTCSACGYSNNSKQAEKFSYKNEIPEAQQIEYLRHNLLKSIDTKNYAQIVSFSNDILKLIPDDFKATYYNAHALDQMNSPQEIKRFYRIKKQDVPESDFNEIAQHIIHFSDLRHKKLIENFLKEYESDLLQDYLDSYDQRRLQEEENFLQIERDVFICHRSENRDIAEAIVKYLEDDGIKCWISYRNIRRDDNQSYWKEIESAIKLCKIFLVISDDEVTVSKDVQKEIFYAQQQNKKRIEFKLDNVGHRPMLYEFFDKHGLKWVDASESIEKSYDVLRYRIAEMLMQVRPDIEMFDDKVKLPDWPSDETPSIQKDKIELQKPSKESLIDSYKRLVFQEPNVLGIDINSLNIDSTKKVPICIILDRSDSMINPLNQLPNSLSKIDELNKNVKVFLDLVRSDHKKTKMCDLALIACGGKQPVLLNDFMSVDQISFKPLIADGGTPLGSAVQIAIELMLKRRAYYIEQGIEHYKPILMIMSDGEPTDDYIDAARDLSKAVIDKKIKVYIVGIGDAFNFKKLKQFSPTSNPKRITEMKTFMDLFNLLSTSISDASKLDDWYNSSL